MRLHRLQSFRWSYLILVLLPAAVLLLLGVRSLHHQAASLQATRKMVISLAMENVIQQMEISCTSFAKGVLLHPAIRAGAAQIDPSNFPVEGEKLLAENVPGFSQTGELWLLKGGRLSFAGRGRTDRVHSEVHQFLKTEFLQSVLGEPMRIGQIYPLAFNSSQPVQLFYSPLSMTPGKQTLLVAKLDLQFASSETFATCVRSAGAPSGVRLVSTGVDSQGLPESHFRTVLPFWKVIGPEDFADGWKEWRVDPGKAILIVSAGGMLVFSVVMLFRKTTVAQRREGLASSFTHDLRTPLSAIRLYADTLANGNAWTREEQQEICRTISGETERLHVALENVLELMRLEHGGAEYELREGSLAEALGPVVGTYSAFWRDQGYEIRSEISACVPVTRFDRGAVQRAALNLMDNAVKFSGDSRTVEVRLREEKGKITFSVRDYGRGFADSDRERIFRKFCRAHEGGSGHGLGLYIVRQVMQAHGGTVEAESVIGAGSEFRLVFPCIKS